MGFLIPPILVKDHEMKDDIGEDLLFMFYIVAGISTLLLLTVIVGNSFVCFLSLQIKCWKIMIVENSHGTLDFSFPSQTQFTA